MEISEQPDSWLIDRQLDLVEHLEDGGYLNDIRKKQIRRELSLIAFELSWRESNGA